MFELKMRYFMLLQSRCRILETYGVKRAISYKTKKSILHMLNENMAESEVDHPNVNFGERCDRRCTHYALSVLTNGSGESASLYINTDNGRYLFNCGEGVQRSSVEHGLKMNRICAVFITYHTWRNIGGITGLALSAQSQGSKHLQCYGPPAIKGLVHGAKVFASLRGINVTVDTANPRFKYFDGCTKVNFVPLYKTRSNNIHKCTSDSQVIGQVDSSIEHNAESKSRKRSHSEARESTQDDEYALCYICETPDCGGHLDMNACVEKGVPPGPLLGLLKSKRDVYLKDGTLVRWKDVLVGGQKAPIFIVVDCPTEEYLDALLNEKEFVKYQSNSNEPAKLIVHFTCAEVMNNTKYQEWMARFPNMTVHLRINEDNVRMDHIDVFRLQNKLHYLNPKVFPQLAENNVPEVKDEHIGLLKKQDFRILSCFDEDEESMLHNAAEAAGKREYSGRKLLKPGLKLYDNMNGLNIVSSVPTLRMYLYPPQKFDFCHRVCTDPVQSLREMLGETDIENKLTEYKRFVEEWESSEEFKKLPEYPKILFLGTGSSAPYKTRNTSAILVEVNKDSMILLDCGEGTYNQLVRFFGVNRLQEIFQKLKLIFISHKHADHHLGLINLLHIREKFLRKHDNERDHQNSKLQQLLLVIPDQVKSWLEYQVSLHKPLLYDTCVILNHNATSDTTLVRSYAKKIGLTKFKTVPVIHCLKSFGVTFTNINGFKITYSGDCIPCESLIKAGTDSDILIHEATFEDGLEEMAKMKSHTTISQAVATGKKMNAKYTLLTHFSQRYSHIPQLRHELPDNVSIVFDNMVVNTRVLPTLQRLTDLYKMTFADKLLEMNNKSMKRILKREYESEVKRKMMINN